MGIHNFFERRFAGKKLYLVGVGLVAAILVYTIATIPVKDAEFGNKKPHFRVVVNDNVDYVQIGNKTFYVYNQVPPDIPTGRARRLPQCILFGTRKAGTTTLKTFLGFHPDIVVPVNHEIHFFDNDENYKMGYSWYVEQMPPSLPGQVTFEKTPRYLNSLETPERIYRMNKTIKLMMVVRHPFNRAVSQYLQAVMRKPPPPKFEEMVINSSTGLVQSRFVRNSLYSIYLSRWLQRFDRRQIHLIDGDNLVANPAQEFKLIEQFLGVRSYFKRSRFHYSKHKGFYCLRLKPGKNYCMGSDKGRPHPHVSEQVTRKLLDYFEPYNQMFYKIVGRNFRWTMNVTELQAGNLKTT